METAARDEGIAGGPPALWRPWALATVVAVLVNLMVRWLALALLPIAPEFGALQPGPIVFWTTVGVAGATGVSAIVRRRAPRSRSLFVTIAVVTLAISFIPDALLLTMPPRAPFLGTSPISVSVLMLLHVTTAAISVGLLLSWGFPSAGNRRVGAGR